MRTTLYLKQADLAIQLAAVILPIFGTIKFLDLSFMLVGYLAVGFTQISSCVVNGLALPAEYKHKHRIAYQYVLASIGLITIAVLAGRSDDQRMFLFYALMVFSPVLAVWYTWLSYKETKFLKALVMRPQFTRI